VAAGYGKKSLGWIGTGPGTSNYASLVIGLACCKLGRWPAGSAKKWTHGESPGTANSSMKSPGRLMAWRVQQAKHRALQSMGQKTRKPRLRYLILHGPVPVRNGGKKKLRLFSLNHCLHFIAALGAQRFARKRKWQKKTTGGQLASFILDRDWLSTHVEDGR